MVYGFSERDKSKFPLKTIKQIIPFTQDITYNSSGVKSTTSLSSILDGINLDLDNCILVEVYASSESSTAYAAISEAHIEEIEYQGQTAYAILGIVYVNEAAKYTFSGKIIEYY